MHNGAFATLDEVVDFYAKGGGTPYGITPDDEDQRLHADRSADG